MINYWLIVVGSIGIVWLVEVCLRVDVVETVVVIGVEVVDSLQLILLGLYVSHSEIYVLQIILIFQNAWWKPVGNRGYIW